ncbi:hypothetical protein sscle_03g026600 [Sclerotinia sclerotiorum 1980 UF-70]|uniref:Uncharacterized protein n=1 Tax=Sclerotinia sclerotiorum (strain ATCC 18683 / 1980 / Ss-1) TaxID=665079 RepID=A0A1D9PYX1_SCLS1|nr:hypothetical protein sscle_03g026600 [Sclerotinia sclerotiorum 1980 UF-70]
MSPPQERTLSKGRNTESNQPLSSPTSNTPNKKFPQAKDRKRKRAQEDEGGSPFIIAPFQTGPRTSCSEYSVKDNLTILENTAVDIDQKDLDPLEYWRRQFCWPQKYFEAESDMSLLARKKVFPISW